MWLQHVLAAWRRRWWPEVDLRPRPASVGGPGRKVGATAADPFERALARLAAAPDGGAGWPTRWR